MPNLDDKNSQVKTENEIHRDLRHKYLNQTQLLQGVAQIEEPSLTPTERIFLLTLAAFQVRTLPSIENYPHPGNRVLMTACGVSSRQGLNKIAERLLEKRLLEKLAHAQGGRGMAVVYRLCVEDTRFPWPKDKPKPATEELPLSRNKPATEELPVSGTKPATGEAETRNSQPGNPQLDPAKPATLELHPDSNSGYKPKEEEEARQARPAPDAAAAAFAALGNIKPFGSKLLQQTWTNLWAKAGPDVDWIDLMEQVIESVGSRNVPALFYHLKRKVERGELKIHPPIQVASPEDQAKAQWLWTTAKTSGWTRDEFCALLHYDFETSTQVDTFDIARLPELQYQAALTQFQQPPESVCRECGKRGCPHRRSEVHDMVRELREKVFG